MTERHPWFGVLGPLRVLVGGEPVPVRAGKQRILLAALLLRANSPVPADELIEHLWGQDPPSGARDTVRAYVMRLRHLIGDPELIETTPGGYLARLGAEQLDLSQARALLDQGRVHEALALWRGPALADVPSDSLHRDEAPRLAELRLHALSQRVAVDLQRGKHAELVPELVALTAEHPLHEGLCGQLVLALYRCGRTAEAMEQYHRLRGRLAEELGTDPGPRLRKLYQQVLATDPELSAPEDTARPVPRQLPASPQRFTGRQAELDRLDRGGPVVISAIDGTGGIGKTWLALHWAHRRLELFPDGQLYVNLRGFDPAGSPLTPEVAVRGFLEALGVPPAGIPAELDAQVGLYRSLVADKHMLVLLDNARDTAQVTPLLPGSPSCTALVTSRLQLAGLVVNHGATLMTLDLLGDQDARRVLVSRLDERRVAAEPEAVAELVRRCAGLPLALAIVAARAAMQPDTPLAVLAEQLGEVSRLDGFDAGELTANLRAVFACSLHALSPEAAQAFRLLGLVPSADIGRHAVRSLTGCGRAQLDELCQAHLVQEHEPGRYRMHDLVRLFAGEQAAALADTEAVTRLVDHYLHTAEQADRWLQPAREELAWGTPAPGCVPEPIADSAQALAWFDAELSCVLAAQRLALDHGLHRQAWQLAFALRIYQWRRMRMRERRLGLEVAVAAAERTEDQYAKVLTRHFLGFAMAWDGEFEPGEAMIHEAAALAERHGFRGQLVSATHSLTTCAAFRKDFAEAVRYAAKTIELAEGGPAGPLAMAHGAYAAYSLQLGRTEVSLRHSQIALELYRSIQHRDGEADALAGVARVLLATGQPERAVTMLRESVEIALEVGNTHNAATIYESLGTGLCQLGDSAAAHLAWQRSVDMHTAHGRTAEADRVRGLMGP